MTNESAPLGEPVALKRIAKEAVWLDYIQRAGRGDEMGVAALYDETNSLVYSLALRMLANVEDAEEVTLDVYNQVWRIARQFNAERGSVIAWLLTLARTRSLDKLRARASRQKYVEPMPDQLDLPASGNTPEEDTAIAQQRRLIRSALDKLPTEQRRVLELAYFQGLSHSELSEHLGEPLGTVKTRIRLGMLKLRELLTAIPRSAAEAQS